MARRIKITQTLDSVATFSERVKVESFSLPVAPDNIDFALEGAWDDVLLVNGQTAAKPSSFQAPTLTFNAFLPYLYDAHICGGIASESEFLPGNTLAWLFRGVTRGAQRVRVQVFDSTKDTLPSIDEIAYLTSYDEMSMGAQAISGLYANMGFQVDTRLAFKPRGISDMSRGQLARVSSDPLLRLGITSIPEKVAFNDRDLPAFCLRVLLSTAYVDLIAAHNGVDPLTGCYVRNPANNKVLAAKDPKRKKKPTQLMIPETIRNNF
jgi:hypothetical protein